VRHEVISVPHAGVLRPPVRHIPAEIIERDRKTATTGTSFVRRILCWKVKDEKSQRPISGHCYVSGSVSLTPA